MASHNSPLISDDSPPPASSARSRPQIVRGRGQVIPTRTIVIGLGNLLLGDDGVGWRVADAVESVLSIARSSAAESDRPFEGVEIERLGVGGLRLMECLTGYDTAILVDAAEFPNRPVGEVRSCCLDDLEDFAAGHLDSAHDASLRTALALGRRLGATLPANIQTVTVQAHRTDVFSEQLSPEVEAAIPSATQAVLDLLAAGRARTQPMAEGATID